MFSGVADEIARDQPAANHAVSSSQSKHAAKTQRGSLLWWTHWIFGTEEVPCTCPNQARAEKRSKHVGRYQFLYNGVRLKGWLPYWDVFVVTLRKVALLAIVVFTRDAGAVIQALLALLLIVVSLALHMRKRPYDSKLLDWHEMFSLMASGITLILGIALTVLADSQSASATGLISSSVLLTDTALQRWQLGLVVAVLGVNAAVIASYVRNLLTIAFLTMPKVRVSPGEFHGTLRGPVGVAS